MGRRRIIAFLAASFLAPSLAAPTRAAGEVPELSVRDVVKKASLSTVRIEIFDKAGDMIGVGSGFFIAPHLVLTNAHVVDDLYSMRIVLNAPKRRVDPRPTILKFDDEADLALLRTDRIDAPPLPIDAGVPVETGQAVVVYGNEYEGEFLASEGIVRAGLAEEIVLSAPIHSGHSGSPVLDGQGRVIGINSASYGSSGISNMGIAIPLPIVAKFMKKPDTPRSFPWAEESLLWPGLWKSIWGFVSRSGESLFGLGAGLFSLYLKVASILLFMFILWKILGFTKRALMWLASKTAQPASAGKTAMTHVALVVWLVALIVAVFSGFYILACLIGPDEDGGLTGPLAVFAISCAVFRVTKRYHRLNRPGRKDGAGKPSAAATRIRKEAGAPAE